MWSDLEHGPSQNRGAMDTSVYALFGLAPEASPRDILERCKSYCSDWNVSAVRLGLLESQSVEEATVNAVRVHAEGRAYLKSAGAMLLDPSARQCYDAWLDACSSPSPEKITLTRSRLLWFNQTTSGVRFGDSMIAALKDMPRKRVASSTGTSVASRPKCRSCLSEFNFSEDYLVLHCHCTTRVGHVGCLTDFSNSVGDKCPVCRQQLLKRHQVSKYLLWNVREKYKFIT